MPGVPRTDIEVGGIEDYALLKTGIYLAREGNYITEYDTLVGEKLAYVLCGGFPSPVIPPSPSNTCWIWSARRS